MTGLCSISINLKLHGAISALTPPLPRYIWLVQGQKGVVAFPGILKRVPTATPMTLLSGGDRRPILVYTVTFNDLANHNLCWNKMA
jgi:hypothetical protein